MKLEDLRKNIDAIDVKIISLLQERCNWVHQVGVIKKEQHAPIFVPEREADLFYKIESINQGKLPPNALKAIYREIVSCSLFLEGGVKVAYLGPEGTWSHQAALKQFGSSVELAPYMSFVEVFDAVERGLADYGVIPIENSTDGSVTPAMDIFVHTSLHICSSIHLNIFNSLLSNCPREDIKSLYSHPQIIGQCRQWIRANFPKAEIIETSSSTVAAQIAKERAHEGAAALGGKLAAEISGLNILEQNIQDKATNTTRFAIIGKQNSNATGNDRTSLCFTIKHESGSLVKALEHFHKHGISLLRIESRPSKMINWEYVFYVDAKGHATESPLKDCLNALRADCSLLKIFGSYPEA